ncbi:putative ribosomal N-acetyltransferase YdaF [bioreactor metagenome]|uniref:Putative ribosomal N-acetyltransferase YdaF n=1 Tax=bioreactor metagenome TaxID=1076179 RepID=A0A645E905_9ZZZZ|nr:GNAT family N-acetyltransferase [Rikenellaceae bacterium]
MIIKIDEELELRQIEAADAKDIFRTINTQREYLGKWLPFVEFTREEADSEAFVDSVISVPAEKAEYVFTIRKNGEFAGLIGFKDTDRQNKKTEIGYWLSEGFQKQGIVTKAVERLCEYAFNKLDINRIQIKCAVGNVPSKNVPKRLRFKLEGIEREGELLTGNIFTDLEIYSKLNNE